MTHFLLMVLYAFVVSLFFATLWRENLAAARRLFLQIFLGLVLGGLALAWLMFPFPAGPPGS